MDSNQEVTERPIYYTSGAINPQVILVLLFAETEAEPALRFPPRIGPAV
jgi:hypothetical protein